MEKIFNLYNDDTDKGGNRRKAVEAALELIHASVSSSAERTPLYTELSKLSEYADHIQRALVVQSPE